MLHVDELIKEQQQHKNEVALEAPTQSKAMEQHKEKFKHLKIRLEEQEEKKSTISKSKTRPISSNKLGREGRGENCENEC